MSQNEKIKIDSLLSNELGDLWWVTNKIKKRYPELQNNEQYQRIIEAITIIEDAAEKLCEQTS
ncbi:hypothetical protein [Lysinibacillus sp. NPDC096212]|uniref:hypothetical protein n=1 Tax=Lysinibacillus sp. NPDC096212 TaxID=3364135 RepID=UPI0038176F03